MQKNENQKLQKLGVFTDSEDDDDDDDDFEVIATYPSPFSNIPPAPSAPPPPPSSVPPRISMKRSTTHE